MRNHNFRLAVATLLIATAFAPMKVQSQTLLLNELMASNDLAYADDFFEFDDWVEIYNAGSLPLSLSGYHLSDDPSDLTKHTFPDVGSPTIPQGGHEVIWCDNDYPTQGVLHVNFKLSAENEGVWLTAPDGVTVIDSIVYPPQQTDISYGRSCDGCEDWVFFNVPTPDDPNVQSIVPTPTFLFLNEVLLANSGNLVDEEFESDPWIEVYNPNDNQINLGGYTLASSLGQSYTLPTEDPASTTVPANGFLLMWMDGQPDQGGHHIGFEAAPANQTFTLSGPDGATADVLDAQFSVFDNVSWGRDGDGNETLVWFEIPTPRVTNDLLVIPPAEVVINECQSLNTQGPLDVAGEMEDWIELYNPTSLPVNLAGYYLTDRLNNPTKWKFPVQAGDSTIIGPNGYMVLWADEDGNQGWNHTNFRLSQSGEALVLRSPDGFSIADSVHFGPSQPDVSRARIPNGSGPFVWTPEVTIAACNDCQDRVTNLMSQAKGPYQGPNPITPGDAFELLETTFWVNSKGEMVLEFAPGEHVCPALPGGMYVLVSANGGCQKLLLFAP